MAKLCPDNPRGALHLRAFRSFRFGRIGRSLAGLCAALLAPAIAGAGVVQVDAGRGPVDVELPDSYDPGVAVPLVLFIHGLGQTGSSTAELYYDLDSLGDEYGFMYMAPDGELNQQGSTYWNAFEPYAEGDLANDSYYLRRLIETVSVQLAVDTRRVYVIGQSLGGIMIYRMACDYGHLLAAVVSHAGGMPAPVPCAPAEAVHLLHIHGTADTVLPYGGSPGLRGAVGSVETWAALQGCALVADTSAAPFNFDFLTPGNETQIASYAQGCTTAGSATLWTLVGGSHVPLPSSEGLHRLIDFLLDHPKPEAGTSFCSGDGSGAACPCGNSGQTGHGCENAAGTGGVMLEAEGFAPGGAGSGTVTLTGTGFPTSASPTVIVVRSSTRQSGGLGSPFGDGLLCVAAPLVRLSATSAATGVSTHSLNHGAGAGEFHYQLWYRSEPSEYCVPSSAFNLSNGLTLVWP